MEDITFVAEDTDKTQREEIRHHEEKWICKIEEEFEDAEWLHVEYAQENNTVLIVLSIL